MGPVSRQVAFCILSLFCLAIVGIAAKRIVIETLNDAKEGLYSTVPDEIFELKLRRIDPNVPFVVRVSEGLEIVDTITITVVPLDGGRITYDIVRIKQLSVSKRGSIYCAHLASGNLMEFTLYTIATSTYDRQLELQSSVLQSDTLSQDLHGYGTLSYSLSRVLTVEGRLKIITPSGPQWASGNWTLPNPWSERLRITQGTLEGVPYVEANKTCGAADRLCGAPIGLKLVWNANRMNSPNNPIFRLPDGTEKRVNRMVKPILWETMFLMED